MKYFYHLLIIRIFISFSALAFWPDAWDMDKALSQPDYQLWGSNNDLDIPVMSGNDGYLSFGRLSNPNKHWPEEVKLYELIGAGYHFNAYRKGETVIASVVSPSFAKVLTPGAVSQLPDQIGSIKYSQYKFGFRTGSYYRFVFAEPSSIKSFDIPDKIAVGIGNTISEALVALTSFFDSKLKLDLSFPIADKLPPTNIGGVIFDNVTRYYSGEYIPPNESAPFWFKSDLKGKRGALVSVGTIRTLIDAGFGDFDLVVGLDISEATVWFNIYHQQLIMQIDELKQTTLEKRVLYLLALQNLWPTNGNNSLQKLYKNELEMGKAREERLLIKRPEDLFGPPPGYIAKTLANMDAAYYGLAAENKNKGGYEAALRRSFQKKTNFNDLLLGRFYDRGRRSITAYYYWESDAAWEKLVGYFKADKVKYIAGDISDIKLLGDLDKAFSNLDIKLSAIDISNVFDYLKSEQKEKFARSFLAMDLDPNVLILDTYRSGGFGKPGNRYDGDWYYGTQLLREFLGRILNQKP